MRRYVEMIQMVEDADDNTRNKNKSQDTRVEICLGVYLCGKHNFTGLIPSAWQKLNPVIRVFVHVQLI